MNDFKHDFELRRVIFGFSAILKMNPQQIPQLVFQRLPDIIKHLAYLCMKMNEERLKILNDNKKYIEKGVNKEDDSDNEDLDSEEEFKKTKEKLEQINKENEKKMDAEDDDTDSDYEYTGGDLALYDSALDDIDELGHVKQLLESIN